MHKDHPGTDVVEQSQASASGGNSLHQPRAYYDSATNRTHEPFPLPLVSVIIPAYNAEKSIARTLDSVLSQTYRNLEVLVINDGSTDKTAEIAESYVWKDPRVRVLHQPNLGLSAARNYGIRFAKGEYIAPIDADDIWHKEKIQAQVECFQHSKTSVGLVYSWSMIIDENGNPLTGIAYKHRGNVLAELIYSNFVGNGSCPLIRRSCFEEIGVFDVHLRACEDRDMYLRIAEQYEFQVVPRYHVGYTKALSSMSANFKNQDKFITTVMDNFEKRHPRIPKTLFRLSRSRTCFYLASLCNEHGRYFDSIKYLLRCLVLDPVSVLSSEYNLSVLKLLVRCTTKPIVSFIWGNQLVWGKLHRRLLTLVGRGPAAQYRLGDGDSIRRRSRLYDRIHNQRMVRLKEIMESDRSWKQKS
jgi:glycosyltransferase involved in cell wall biosynthesis